MSCITAKVTRASEPCDIQVSKTEGIGVVVMAVISAVTAAVTFVSSLIVKATSVPGVNTEVALEERVNVIPVRIGQVGHLYDRVSGTLFSNAGTGSFTLGPDVT